MYSYKRLSEISAVISIISVTIPFLALTIYFKLVEMPYIILFAAGIAAIGAMLQLKSTKLNYVSGRIFIAYAREDKEKVVELYNTLKKEGFKPWLDEKNLLPGQNWESTILEAIRSSEVVLACLSKNSSAKKGFINKEFQHALNNLNYHKNGMSPVIPVRLEETNVPERLSTVQRVDLFEKNGINKLIKSLREIITNSSVSE
ncbi:MAG: TIR protein [Candidatus Magnetoglobus multicellularis str. Araruama]|uniref:TIR protein n=1 Tax=Candidatus Magnetoglobus multicellularis str. Araruama TaxID=890399 RepID=A0A1V1PEC1_9BACT|nr:MAG: TIR protein [Candidatus Magnetoglobus multicellularis str. Araruama]